MTIYWRKSSHSGTATDEVCIELGRLEKSPGIGVRDSKDPDGGHLTLTTTQFASLLKQIKHHLRH